MELSWWSLNVSVGEFRILKNVSGNVTPGELLAVMGPSGAGKTTLMNTLNGRMPYSGEIHIGDRPLNKAVKRQMCYVLQQEYFFGNLSLQETLQFAAMIRLPDEMSREEKMLRMKSVVETLDLTKCLNTNMGDMFTPGLSGGEKKRASIACELLRDPAVIFLDEPTTGLDSSTAFSLICLLKTYAAQSGKTVIASIHQPSTQIFFKFDKLMLMTGGQVAYFGKTSEVVDHFKSVGIEIDDNYNPADFILEALSESEEIRNKLVAAAVNNNRSEANEIVKTEPENSQKKNEWSFIQRFTSKLEKTSTPPQLIYEDSMSDLDAGSVQMNLLDLEIPANDLYPNNDKRWPTGIWTQYTQLTMRTFRESRRRILCFSKLLENMLICAFVCLIFFRLPRKEETLRDRMGVVFFIAAHWGFIPLFDAVTSFPMERMVINKERSAHWYRLSAYYLAKMTSELVLILIQPTVFVVVAYWVIGLNGIEAFFATLGTVYIDSIAGQSFGLFVGIACLQISQAMTVSITFQMGIMLLGGLFTRNIPVWLDWMKYLSFLHYSFHSLMVLEFKDASPVQCAIPAERSAFTVCHKANTTVIHSEHVLQYYSVTWSYWQYILPLILFTAIFRTLGYITLRYFRKPFG